MRRYGDAYRRDNLRTLASSLILLLCGFGAAELLFRLDPSIFHPCSSIFVSVWTGYVIGGIPIGSRLFDVWLKGRTVEDNDSAQALIRWWPIKIFVCMMIGIALSPWMALRFTKDLWAWSKNSRTSDP